MDFEIPIIGFPMENEINKEINVMEFKYDMNIMSPVADQSIPSYNSIPSFNYTPSTSSQFTFTDFSDNSVPFVSTGTSCTIQENPMVVKNMVEMDDYPVQFHRWSISREDIPAVSILGCSSHKSSIDLPFTCMAEEEEQVDSPVAPSVETSSNEMPPLHLPPPALSLLTLLQNQVNENRLRECKKRRRIRMEILKRKREEGLISFSTKIRYEQRSEFAMKRVRSSGRFVSEIQYKTI